MFFGRSYGSTILFQDLLTFMRYFRNVLNPLWILVLNLDLPRSSDPKMSRFFHAYLAGAIGLRGPIHKLNMSSIIYFLAGVLGGTFCYLGSFQATRLKSKPWKIRIFFWYTWVSLYQLKQDWLAPGLHFYKYLAR